jgi:hypothetical protein
MLHVNFSKCPELFGLFVEEVCFTFSRNIFAKMIVNFRAQIFTKSENKFGRENLVSTPVLTNLPCFSALFWRPYPVLSVTVDL